MSHNSSVSTIMKELVMRAQTEEFSQNAVQIYVQGKSRDIQRARVAIII